MQSFLKSVIYTMGHITIALICAVTITGSQVYYATVDAIVEPLINGLWFFILDTCWPNGSTLKKTLVYTTGHVIIATYSLVIITGSSFRLAVVDAIVEPGINAVWYYLLDYIWKKKHSTRLIHDP
ncbi:MAG: DUF2061 domain-containing protein [Pseudomonadota bacterium]|nr:DUF2061 domain-containing protein [Pseudomonadota bacterium]